MAWAPAAPHLLADDFWLWRGAANIEKGLFEFELIFKTPLASN